MVIIQIDSRTRTLMVPPPIFDHSVDSESKLTNPVNLWQSVIEQNSSFNRF